MNKKKIGIFLKKLRKEKGLSQEQLSEIFSYEDVIISKNAISQWETGKSVPDLINLQLLANYFHVKIDEILDGQRYIKPNLEDKYFLFNEDKLNTKKDSKTGKIIYPILDQIKLIKQNFNNFISLFVKDELGMADREEFEFLFNNYFDLIDDTDCDNEFDAFIRKSFDVINDDCRMSNEEKIWKIQTLCIPKERLRADFLQFCDGQDDSTKIRFNAYEDWEKDALLAIIQTKNPYYNDVISYHSKTLDYIKDEIGANKSEEELTKNVIKFFIKNGACLNNLYMEKVTKKTEAVRIIDRVEELYCLCKQPNIVGVIDDKVRYFKVENNFNNRFYYNYIYALRKLFPNLNDEQIKKIFNENEFIPIKFIKDLASKEGIDLMDDFSKHSRNFERKYDAYFCFWEKYKESENKIKQGLQEIEILEQLLKNGETFIDIQTNNIVGSGKHFEKINNAYLINKEISKEDFEKSRNHKLTQDLMKEIDKLSLKEIRAKYFSRGDTCDE